MDAEDLVDRIEDLEIKEEPWVRESRKFDEAQARVARCWASFRETPSSSGSLVRSSGKIVFWRLRDGLEGVYCTECTTNSGVLEYMEEETGAWASITCPWCETWRAKVAEYNQSRQK